MPTLLEVSAADAKRYLMEPANFVNFDLPQYFDFKQLLQKTADYIGDKRIHELFALGSTEPIRALNPKDYEGVNYRLIGNKDGEFAWRPFEIIHPALYVSLVNELTSPACWAELRDRFSLFQKTAVRCESIPFVSEDREKHKAHQIKRWWENIEQESLRRSLNFGYVYDVDISDCYGSIYTHSLAWALHGKETMKDRKNRIDSDFLGNRIDWLIQKMRHGQTNGIPQGSTVMDLIAEILLGYMDMLLTRRIDDLGYDRLHYTIIRFRDDYKILSNNPELGRTIVRELSGVLSDHGLKLNTSKTRLQSDPVLASLKADKLYELFVPKNKMTMSKRLMQIYKCADAYPNSGLVTRQLNHYYRDIARSRSLSPYDDPRVMIGIVVNLAIKNPKSYQWSMAILSHLLGYCPISERATIIDDIRKKFSVIPNTGILDIWLQRISYAVDPSLLYTERLAKIASGEYHTNIIWRSGWLEPGLQSIVTTTPIVERPVIDTMGPLILPKEVELFNFPVYY